MVTTSIEKNEVTGVVDITKEQAIRLIEAVVLCFGTQSFVRSGALAHRSIISFKEFERFMPDELEAGVKVALSMAVEHPSTYVTAAALQCEVRRVVGDMQGPIWYRVDYGSNYKFDPNTPL